MEWVGIEHKNGPWTLRTKSCGDGTKELSSLDRTIQRALSRFRQVVKVYTETQASQSPATYEGRDPHEVLCDFAQRLKKHHPYVCDTELICVKAPQASDDDTAATSCSATETRVHASKLRWKSQCRMLSRHRLNGATQQDLKIASQTSFHLACPSPEQRDPHVGYARSSANTKTRLRAGVKAKRLRDEGLGTTL